MSDPSADASSGGNRLDELAEEFVQRHQRGEHPSLTEYTDRYPDLADEIRELFPALALMQDVRPKPGAATGPYEGAAPGPGGAPLGRLGDYRILREVGRGGMGIVYEAEQESLGRHVALKVLPAHALLDGQRLERFRREARSAARLHHTNIVPVYGVGAQDGLHYYVMQFIPGQALDQVLDELKKLRRDRQASTTAGRGGRAGDVSAADVAQALLTGDFASQALASGGRQPPDPSPYQGADAPRSPGSDSAVRLPGSSSARSGLSESGRAYWQSLARLGIQVAEALAYAHGQGTLHRDVKPSNLLLDTRGTVWVTDFGLAKAADGGDLTNTGDLVGTLRYMAPERFAGRSDGRSDVYALGLTLYELLTLRPAFEAADRHKLIDQVKTEEPPRPGKLDPSVPRDLETVVLKAMAKDPGHRYQAAGELAEDLRRFAEDKPIRARPVSSAERLWRWSRRNPSVAGLTGAVGLLLVVVAVVFALAALAMSAARTEADRQADAARGHAEEAKEARQREAEERQRAEARLARLYVSNGTRALEQGDLFGSLPWFVEALKIEQGQPERAELHRIRLRSILRGCPRILALHHDGLKGARFSPDGRRVLTDGWRWLDDHSRLECETRLWDAGTGRPLTPPIKHESLPIGESIPSYNGRHILTFEMGLGEEKGRVRVWDAATGQPVAPGLQPAGPVVHASFSPDGRRVLTVSQCPSKLPDQGKSNGNTGRPNSPRKTEARVWDVVTGQPLTTAMRPDRWITSASFSPDGRRIVTVSGDSELWLRPGRSTIGFESSDDKVPGEVGVWDAATGQLLTGPLQRTGMNLVFATFSPDGRRVLAAAGGGVLVWDGSTGRLLIGPLEHPGLFDNESRGQSGVHSAALFSPDGRRILTTSGHSNPVGETRVWDAVTGRLLARVPHLAAGAASFSPDGRRILTVSESGGDGGEARVWEADTGQPVTPPLRHDLRVLSASFSPDGRRVLTVSEGAPGEARVWDAATGSPLTPPLKHGDEVPSAEFSPDGRRVLTVSMEGIARVWDLATAIIQPSQLGEGTDPFSFLPPGHAGHGISHRSDTLELPASLFSPDGRHVLIISRPPASDRVEARVWDTTTGQPVTPPLKHDDGLWINLASFSPDGRLLVTACSNPSDAPLGSGKKTELHVWDLTTGTTVCPPIKSELLAHLAFSLDGRLLLTWGEAVARVWDTATGRPVTPALQHENASVSHAAISPDGKHVLTTDSDGKLRVWDVASGQPVAPSPWQETSGGQADLWFAAYSPDGRRVLTADAKEGPSLLRVRDAATGRPVAPPIAPGTSLSHVLFSPDGRRILTLTGKVDAYFDHTEARVWDAATGQPVTPPLKHRSNLSYACFSRDGRRVLSTTDRHLAQVWDAATGEPVTLPLTSPESWQSVAFAADGRRVLTLSWDGRVQAWDLSPDERPLPDLVLLAGLLDCHRIDDSGASVPFRAERADWEKLQKDCPDLFAVSAQRGSAWHQDEAEKRETAQDWFAAVFHLDRLIAEQGGSAPLYRRRGLAHANLGEQARAVLDFTKAIELQPDDQAAWLARAHAFDELAQYEKAVADCTRAIALNGRDPAAWLLRGEVHAKHGLHEPSRRDFARAVEFGPDDFSASASLVRACLAVGDRAAARKVCAAMLKHSNWISSDVAWIYVLVPDAVPDWQPVLRLAKASGDTHLLGAAQYRSGQYDAAIQTLKAAPDKPEEGRRIEGWLFLALAHHRLGHKGDARAALAEGVRRIGQATREKPADAAGVPLSWELRLELQILRREAEELLNGKATDPRP
jgi:WD40 repeat protein/serine/threonine protein kinase/tetratricopeptide (TPR) repeat protein